VIAPAPDADRIEQAADFVRRFADYWQDPSRDGLDTVLAEDVCLVAPLTPTSEGLEEAKRSFGTVFDAIPDLTAEVRRWGATEDGVLIEFTLSGTIGGDPISWDVIDRFVLDGDGLATERVSYFDPTTLQPSSPT
jgi:SnoaL-like domain